MKRPYKKFVPLLIGFVVVLIGIISLAALEVLLLPNFKEEFVEIILIFMFWWALVSFVIYRIPYILKNKRILYTIILLLFLFYLIFATDRFFNIPDNPITISLLSLFWLGTFYLLAPSFFKKYWKLIASVYGALLSYFLYVRLFTAYLHEEHTTLVNISALTFPAIIVLWLFEQWKWLQHLKKDKASAELQLLKSQINPHFFFNTLNNLYGLTVEKSDDAPKVVLKLSDMMRYTIYEGKEDEVSLKDEINYLENYIALHKIRYHQHVAITFDHLLDADYKVAPLLFIILLENAFKHGVERLTKDAYIHISLEVANDVIKFRIENNYESISNTGHKGIGIDNLKKRLQLIYPKKHKLVINKKEQTYRVNLEIDIK